MAKADKRDFRYPTSSGSIGQFIIFYRYTHKKTAFGSITLAAPSGFTIGDGASYGNIDLGVLGGDKKTAAATETTAGAAPSREAMGMAGLGLSIIGGGSGPVAAASNLFSTKNSIAKNPNTVTQFSNSNVRSYSFEFTLVPNSLAEWKEIKGIVNSFRESLYPEKLGAASLLLNYPDKWKFSFEDGAQSQVPGSWYCFLTDMSTSYNNFGNAYHEDGVPNDVKVTLTLQETKALTRGDIQDLANGGSR